MHNLKQMKKHLTLSKNRNVSMFLKIADVTSCSARWKFEHGALSVARNHQTLGVEFIRNQHLTMARNLILTIFKFQSRLWQTKILFLVLLIMMIVLNLSFLPSGCHFLLFSNALWRFHLLSQSSQSNQSNQVRLHCVLAHLPPSGPCGIINALDKMG